MQFLKQKNKKTKKKRVYKNVINLYNTQLAVYFNASNSIIDEEKEEIDKKYDLSNLFLKGYIHDKQYKKFDEEKSKLQSEETIAEKMKLIPRQKIR